MINYQRVRRIKNVIYAVITVLFFLPFILILVVCASMLSKLNETHDAVNMLKTYIDSGYYGEADPGASAQSSGTQGRSSSQNASVRPPVSNLPASSAPSAVSSAVGDLGSSGASEASAPPQTQTDPVETSQPSGAETVSQGASVPDAAPNSGLINELVNGGVPLTNINGNAGTGRSGN